MAFSPGVFRHTLTAKEVKWISWQRRAYSLSCLVYLCYHFLADLLRGAIHQLFVRIVSMPFTSSVISVYQYRSYIPMGFIHPYITLLASGIVWFGLLVLSVKRALQSQFSIHYQNIISQKMQRQGGSSHKCTRCQAQFTSMRAYNIHISVCLHRHICKFCPGRKEFDNFTVLQNHLEKFHLFCEPCHWFAPSALGLRQHNVARHFVCVACGDYFINAHELNGVR